MTFDELMRELLKILPGASIGEDNDGQLIVYTNLRESTTDTTLVDMDLNEEDM